MRDGMRTFTVSLFVVGLLAVGSGCQDDEAGEDTGACTAADCGRTRCFGAAVCAIAPPLDPSVPTTLYAASRFLWDGPAALQVGVAPETIDPARVAVLRG